MLNKTFFATFLRPQHSRGKSTALKHFCKCFILHVTTVLMTNLSIYAGSAEHNADSAKTQRD